MPPTAFVAHPDCSRHDTGWKHPDHQGRLPALFRAVYRDMLTLHGHLVEIEARPATQTDLLLVHTPEHIERVRAAAAHAAETGQPGNFTADIVVSAASWDAALAAAGTALSGVDAVLTGTARNAFCAARPPGHAATKNAAGEFSLFNNVAVAARHLQQRHGVERLLVVEWAARPAGGLVRVLGDEPRVRLLTLCQQTFPAAPELLRNPYTVMLPPGTAGEECQAAFESGLHTALSDFSPEFILLAAGFDGLDADPLGDLAFEPADYYGLTRTLRERADEVCGGRLVSVLEGGYAAAEAARAALQHLRALAALPPISAAG